MLNLRKKLYENRVEKLYKNSMKIVHENKPFPFFNSEVNMQ